LKWRGVGGEIVEMAEGLFECSPQNGGAANLNNWSVGAAVRLKIKVWWNSHAQLQVVVKKSLQMVRVRSGIGSLLIRFWFTLGC
jgi:hypothetical protein